MQSMAQMKESEIIEEFGKLMRGEIQAVNIANACNRAGIQQMIETTIKDHRFNPTLIKELLIHNGRFVDPTILTADFIEQLAKYATSNLSVVNASDIKITRGRMIEILDVELLMGKESSPEKEYFLSVESYLLSRRNLYSPDPQLSMEARIDLDHFERTDGGKEERSFQWVRICDGEKNITTHVRPPVVSRPTKCMNR